MSEQKETVSEDIGETRTYAEIAAAKESGSTEEGSKSPVPGATVETEEVSTDTDETVETETSQQTTDEEPQTLEEAKALLAKLRKESESAQSLVGKHGQEVGDVRKELAELRAELAAKEKPAEESKAEEFNSYVELFEADETFKGMNEASRQYLGHAFDLLEKRLLDRVTKAPEIESLRQTVTQTELEKVQSGWVSEATQLQEAYGKELLDKHGPEISRIMTEAVQKGADPKDLSVSKIFKELAFDDIAGQRTEPGTGKGELNKQAKKQPAAKTRQSQTETDYSKLDKNTAWEKMLAEDRKRGLVP